MTIKNTFLTITFCTLNIVSSTHTAPSDYRAVRYATKATRIAWHAAQVATGGIVTSACLAVVLHRPIRRFLLSPNPEEGSLTDFYFSISEEYKKEKLIGIGSAFLGSCGVLGTTTLHAGLKGLYKELAVEAALKLAREKIQNVPS